MKNKFKLFRATLSVNRKFQIAMVLVVLVVVGMTNWVYQRVLDKVEENLRIEQTYQIALNKKDVMNLMGGMKEDVLMLSGLSSLDDLMNGGGLDEKVRHDFVSFVGIKELYYQVRYIDETGQEIVRVDSVDGEIMAKEEGDLQNKLGRYYFEEAVGLEMGQVYVSPMDLNMEGGELENRGTVSQPRYVPTMRYATPVHDSLGESRGIVIVNIYAEHILELLEGEDESVYGVVMLDQDGYYLRHPDKSKLWGRDLGTEENMYTDFPKFKQGTSKKISGSAGCSTEGGLMVYTKIFPSEWSTQGGSASGREIGESEQYWILTKKVNSEEVFGIKLDALLWIGMVLAGVMPISLIYYLLLVRGMLMPLKKLQGEVEEYDDKGGDRLLLVRSSDEIGRLTESFNRMIVKMRGMRLESEEMVKKRTSELEQIRSKLEKQQSALLNVLEDVSEEKEYESSRSKSLLETVNEGIVVVDGAGVVSYVNPAFEKLLGYEEEELKGKVLADTLKAYGLKDEELPPESLSTSKMVSQGEGELKIKIGTKKGDKIALSISAAPVYQAKEFRGVVMVMHDFSKDLKLAQQKDDFFSIASHELRTPLTVISGNLDMLAGGVGGSKLTDEDMEMLSDTLEAADRLTRMVADFLNVSRIDQGRLQLHLTNVLMSDVINGVIKEYKGIVEKKGLKLRFSCKNKGKMVVKGDEDKLREVLINLIGNSLKFTQKGEIVIEGEVKGDKLEVRIVDTGMGIDEDKQGLLFQRFQQAMSRTLAREAGGTGLGLYISREFMRLMKGDLRLVKSVKGKGSTFALTMPLVGKQQTANSKRQKRKKVKKKS